MPSYSSRSLLLATLLIGALPSSALAHAPPEVLDIVSSKPDDVVVATNRGLIFGNLQTRTFSLLCNLALGVDARSAVSESEAYRIAQLPSGRLLLTSSTGMRVSDDRGCSFRDVAALAQLSTPHMVQHPRDRQRVYVSTAGVGQIAVRVSADEGETFQTLLGASDDIFFQTLLVAPTEPTQLYASAIVVTSEGPYLYYVTRSVDDGKTWQKHDVALTDDERDLTLLAVNPHNPDEILARASAAEPALGERLMWSRDGGKTFSSPLTLRVLRSASFSADGKVAYAGGVDGLWQAATPDRRFTQVADTARVSDLRPEASELLVSGYYRGIDATQDGIGVGSPGGNGGLSRWLDFSEVREPVSCAAPSMVDKTCFALWHDWEIENPQRTPLEDAGASSTLDAGGPPDGGSSADAGTNEGGAAPLADAGKAPSGGDGGCSVTVGSPRAVSAWLVPTAALLCLLSRCRRARRLPRAARSS